MATSGSSGSSGGGGGGSAGKAAGLATPEASGSSETLEDDQPPQGSAEGKRKKFHPLRAVRKIFRWKAKRQGSQEVVGPSKKSRSTGELQSVPDEDQRLKGPVVPYSIGLSVSHDSVFSPDTSMAMADSDGLHQGSSLSVNRTSHKLVFKDELFTRVQARRDSDDDDMGLPHSPCTSPTTADVLSRGLQAKTSKPQSTCSAGSLSSMFSSENDEDAAVQATLERRTDAAEADVSADLPLPLNHNAALHKISVKPKRTHALPRHRMLQALSAAAPRLLPTTPELSEDSSKAPPTQQVESSEATPEVAGEDGATPTTSQARNLPPLPKPAPNDQKDDEKVAETPKLDQAQGPFDVVEDVKDEIQCENADSRSEDKDAENLESPPTPPSANPKLDEHQSSDLVAAAEDAQDEHEPAPSSRITISNNEVTVSRESHLIKDSSEVTVSSARDEGQALRQVHHSPKPKAAELKLRHEIAQFNKRQREMGRTLDYGDTDEATAEMIDIQESIRTLDLAIESGESKDGNEYFDEQDNLDLVNGNVQFGGERYNGCVGAPEKASHATESQVAASDTMEASMEPPSEVISFGPRKLSQPHVAARESVVPAPRRISSVEVVQGVNAGVSPLPRPLSVEILPFSQRRKEQNYPPSPTKADGEGKLEDTRRSTPQLTSGGNSDGSCDLSSDVNGPEKNHMSYPIHFRIYKGRRSSLVTEKNGQSVSSSPPKGPALNGDETAIPSPQFEVKIQSMSEKESKPEVAPRAIFLENGERVELRNHHGQQFAKERSKSASDMTGSPPRRDDIRPRPFTRSIFPKNSEVGGEPELFKVFARRSLKQKSVEKHAESDANGGTVETAAVKPDVKPELLNGHGTPAKGSGGTIVQISELGTTVDSLASNKLHRARQSGSVSSLIETNEKTSAFGSVESPPKAPQKQADASPVPHARESLGRSSALQSSEGSPRLPGLKSSEFLAKSVTVVNSESYPKPVVVNNGASQAHSLPSKCPESPGRGASCATPPVFHAAKPVGFKQDGLVSQRNGDLGPASKSVTIVAPEASSDVQRGEATGAPEMQSPLRRNLHASRPRFHTSPEVAQEELAKVTGVQKKPHAPFEKTSSVSSNSSISSVEGGSVKGGKALQRASSVSSASPSSTGSFRASKMAASGGAPSTPGCPKMADEQQPSWLQLAQQRRELREQRERLMLGRPADSSFVLETSSKPSRSSKVLDMVSNFQKLQMT
ncbi:unnamed protein product [Ixodes pacificus]